MVYEEVIQYAFTRANDHYSMRWQPTDFVAFSSLPISSQRVWSIILLVAALLSLVILVILFFKPLSTSWISHSSLVTFWRKKDYEHLPAPQVRELANGISNSNGYLKKPDDKHTSYEAEVFVGIRAYLGIALSLVHIALLNVHVIILVTGEEREDARLMRITLVAFWAYVLILNLSRFVDRAYRWRLYNAVYILQLVPLVLHIQEDLFPRMTINTDSHSIRDPSWQFYSSFFLTLAANLIPFVTPQVYRPLFSPDSPYSRPSPIQTCTPLSYYITYYFVEYLIRRGISNELQVDDLPPLPDTYRASFWKQQYKEAGEGWKANRAWKTLGRCMWITRICIVKMCFWSVVESVLSLSSPFAMNHLLQYLENPPASHLNPYFWVFAMLFVPIGNSIVIQQYFVNSIALTAHAKSALVQALYEKTLRVRIQGVEDEETTEKNKIGRINNLMSSDIESIVANRDAIFFFLSIPIGTALSLFYLYYLLGWAAFVGFGCMLVTMPIPILMYIKYGNLQVTVMKRTDDRIGLVGEMLNSMRAIKYFGWERPMMSRVNEKRDAEQKMIWKSPPFVIRYIYYTLTGISGAMLSVLTNFVNTALPLMNLIVTLLVYTKLQKRVLTSSIAFTAISLFNILSNQFIYLGMISRSTVQMFVSLKRMDDYLYSEEELEETSGPLQSEGENKAPKFENATFSWESIYKVLDSSATIVQDVGTTEANHPTGEISVEETVPPSAISAPAVSSPTKEFYLRDIDLTFHQGLNLIVGPIGSGKSSLLLALLGEMHCHAGSYRLNRAGGVAYVAQTAWLQNATIRDNILFGGQWDSERYDQVIKACALEVDLELFEAGDKTEIGERGITLSGGQKQRLALARAVYSSAQTLLLDDVLSALDVHVGKYVFENCICGDILRGRTVLLVTHHVGMTRSKADKIVVMKEGMVVSSISSADSFRNLEQAEALIEEVEEDVKIDQGEVLTKVDNTTTVNGKDGKRQEKSGKLVMDEERAIGRISRLATLTYMGYFGNFLFLGSLAIAVASNQALFVVSNWWVAQWSDAYAKLGKDVNVDLYLAVAAIISGATALSDGFASLFFFRGTWNAAKTLHAKLIASVFAAPISWFDVTPVGRVINRFAKDIGSLDNRLLMWLRWVIDSILRLVFRVGAVSTIMPIFMVPAIAVSLLGYTVGELYTRASIAIKRCSSVSESPMFSHFGDTIVGAVTIRAFGAQSRFANENLEKIDTNIRTYIYLFFLNRWVNMRGDILGSVMTFVAALIALRNRDIAPGLVGFSLVNAIGFGDTILYLVRCLNGLEIEMNSFERIVQYINLKAEPPSTKEGKPPAAWPTDGDLVVKNLSVKYSSDGPEVLSDVSFSVEPHERVGICGRTGSGKSTLCLTFLRFTTKTQGNIFINGLDIDKINLEDLRNKVSIIPQDPVLFSGTIRSNLDPFGDIGDLELNDALHQSGLLDEKEEVSVNAPVIGSVTLVDSAVTDNSNSGASTPRRKVTLDTPVSSNGENFSQGQRQILALARALVRRSKVIILDEATASVDHETDERIQKALRTEFKECTLITIAHRLRTIMDYDKILVLQEGKVIEFDTPSNLLKNKNGAFFGMVSESGEFESLKSLVDNRDGRSA